MTNCGSSSSSFSSSLGLNLSSSASNHAMASRYRRRPHRDAAAATADFPSRNTAAAAKSRYKLSPSFALSTPFRIALLFAVFVLTTSASSSSSASTDSRREKNAYGGGHHHSHPEHNRPHDHKRRDHRNHKHHHHHHHEKHLIDVSFPESHNPPLPPRVSLGIADASASVGRLFEYSIPPHAFSGNVASFRASEAGLARLPKWLGFKSETGLFYGVPAEDDVGQTFISVTAIGKNDGRIRRYGPGLVAVENEVVDLDASLDSGAKDVFSITVDRKTTTPRVTAVRYGSTSSVEPKECAPGEPSTIASVIVDRAYGEMEVEEKVRLLEKFGEFVQLPMSSLSLFSNSSSRRIFDSSALVAGPGNAKGKRKGVAVFLQWQIGCGHDFTQANINLLETIELCSVNGTLAQKLGRNVIGWHVVNRQPIEKPRRKKRRLNYNPRATATLQPGPIAPTKAAPSYLATPTLYPVPPEVSSSSSSAPAVKPTRTRPVVVPTRDPDPWSKTTTTTLTTSPPRNVLLTSSTLETKKETTTTPELTTTTATTTEKKKTTTTEPPLITTTTTAKINLAGFDCEEGKYCEHRLPRVDRMFPDLQRNDGGVEISLLKGEGIGLPHNTWIKYDTTENMIYGLPLKDHLKPRVMELVVLATDSVGNVFRDAITVKVHQRKGKHKKKFNHEFLFKFGMDHNKFKTDVDTRIRFLNTLASIFGSSKSDIVMTRVKGGSTVVGWSNDTLPYSPCPINDVNRLKGVVLDKRDRMRKSVMKPMAENGFILSTVSFFTHGPCSKLGSHQSNDPEIALPAEPAVQEADRDWDIWITTVLPAVVVAVVLVLAACIACILYKKSRRGKLSLSDKRTFLNKGIPVIFVDELQENPEPPHTPLILKEEKPPLPPPEYPRSSNGSAPSTPPSEHKEPLSTTEDEHEEGDFPPLHSTGSVGRRSDGAGTLPRLNGHPAPFRAPPPYMPPS